MKTTKIRSPWATWFLGSTFAAVSCWLYQYHLHGGAAVLSLVTAFVAVGLAIRGCHDWEIIRRFKRLQKKFDHAAAGHGTSRAATVQEVQSSALGSGKGIFLGTLPKTVTWKTWCNNLLRRPAQNDSIDRLDIYHDSDCSLLILAPPGSNKSTSIAMPTLLEDKTETHVVHDPSGELYAVSSTARRAAGEVIVICPWAKEMSTRLGLPIRDAGFGFYAGIDPKASPEILVDELKLRSSLLVKDSERANESGQHFIDGGRRIIDSFALHAFALGETPQLPAIRSQLMRSLDLEDKFVEMGANEEDFGGMLAEYGQSLGALMNTAPEEFSGCLSTGIRGLELFDRYGPLGRHVSQPGFDPRSLKDDRPLTVYVIIPTERQITHAAYTNALFSLLIETVARDPRNRTVNFLLDETFALGRLPVLTRSLAIYRKLGVRGIFFFQAIPQIVSLYGESGMRELLANIDTIAASNIVDNDTLKTLSEMSGVKPIHDVSSNQRAQAGGEDPSFGDSHKGAPWLRPDEIRRLSANQRLIFHGRLHPILAQKTNYWERQKWADDSRPNPYYNG